LIPPTSLDIVTVAIEVTSKIIDSETAEIVGPYSVIIMGAVGGATWSASSRGGTTRWATFRYVCWMIGLALIVAVPLAAVISNWTEIAPRWMLAPVAVLVAARPDWIWGEITRFVDARRGKI
jgi:hypothetical protein